MKLKALLCTAAALLVLSAAPVFAQDPGDPGDLGPTPSAQPAGVPIDGGASMLAAAGISYGLKRVRAKRKAQKAALKNVA
ncbi:MAG: hypothetical protein V4543_15565 [Bacteroidota bacterium]